MGERCVESVQQCMVEHVQEFRAVLQVKRSWIVNTLWAEKSIFPGPLRALRPALPKDPEPGRGEGLKYRGVAAKERMGRRSEAEQLIGRSRQSAEALNRIIIRPKCAAGLHAPC